MFLVVNYNKDNIFVSQFFSYNKHNHFLNYLQETKQNYFMSTTCSPNSIPLDLTNQNVNNLTSVSTVNGSNNISTQSNNQTYNNPQPSFTTQTAGPPTSSSVVNTPSVYNIPASFTHGDLVKITPLNFTGKTNGNIVRATVGLYKPVTLPLNTDTLIIEFGYIPVSGLDADFRILDSKSFVVGSDFDDLCSLNAFYNSEFGTVTPSFNFASNKVLRLEFFHQLYDYNYYSATNKTTFFAGIHTKFAFRIKFGSKSTSVFVGVACGLFYS